MSTLALDLGTKTGWALAVDDQHSIMSGTWDFASKRHEDSARRYSRFRDWLSDMHDNYSIKLMHYEEVRRHAGTSAAHVYGGFQAILMSFCLDEHISYESVPVGEIKKLWTGKGNAKKEAMIAECQRRGYFPQDDNEADAIAILCVKMGWVA